MTVIAVFFDWKWIEFIAKPIIIPAIFYYYTQINKNEFSLVLVILLILNFISDMTAVFNYENKGDIIIALNLIANVLLTYYYLFNFSILKNYDRRNIFQFIFFLICFLIITYIFLTLIPGLNPTKIVYYIIYGSILSFMGTLSIQNYLATNSLKSFYAMLICISCIITDTSYVIYNFYLPMKIFIIISLGVQFGTYFYLVKYFATKEKKEI